MTMKEYQKIYYQKNKRIYKKQHAQYYIKNRKKIRKRIETYSKSKRGREKRRKSARKRYVEYKNIVKELKINGCSICGYNKSRNALHFHHVLNNRKILQFSTTYIRGNTNRRITIEFHKCMLLCCICHCEIHDKDRGC
jgi:esterase/lipase superfamily enzyme